MSRAQAESVIKNIIREIAQECAVKGQAVSETLVAFMVKAVVLDPDNQFNVERTLTKDDVQKLIKTCVDRLLMSASPSLDTIKMQVYFDMNYTNRNEFLEEHKRVLESRLQPVMREITDSRARTREELEGLYRKIVSCVLLRSGLGSPTDISVVREATAALQSVFPQTELGTFMSLTKRDKERQLRELTQIVTGIRLFNKECGKGGEGIDNLPSILNEAIPSATMNIENELNSTRLFISRYTALIERQNAELLEEPEPDMLRQAVINCRQHEAFLKVLLNDVVVATDQVNTLERDLRSVLIQLQNTIQSKTAVPTNQVYPKFISLAKIWTGFQDEMVLLSVISNIQANLEPFTRSHKEVLPDSILQPLLTGLILRSDEERITETSGLEGRVEHAPHFKNLEFLFPETTRNFSQLPLQYKGFCGFSIAVHDRLLLPGNPLIGVLRYKDHFFCFTSKEAAVKFAADPDRYIAHIAEAAKRSPELIQLLELHMQFSTITPYGKSAEPGHMIEKPLTKRDSGIQTEVHPIESNIDPDYEWNEWEMRRKAIKLANLRTRITHSVQTDGSNFRRNNATQIYQPKTQDTQTTRVKGTSVPKPSVFIAGLRGCKSETTEAYKVDLTLDVDTHNDICD
ncbi:cilia- and flagella-associated protein 206-like [Bolinopsis microptera]|uniref:cilia- and flagella-associated protein 206-like n=1 Tax=Bolinopsis microptera TaxID=2820187 RepID=UPI003079E601